MYSNRSEVDDEAAVKIRRTIYSYRTNPEIFPTESRDVQRMDQINQLPGINWTDCCKEKRSVTKPELIIVVDTEFLLCNLRLIAEVVDRLTVSVWLVLPWVVVKELDALKMSDEYLGHGIGKCVGDLAMESIYLLHHLISSAHPSVVGQQMPEMIENCPMNIDKIVDCAKYFKTYSCPLLVLLAGDREIREKAHASHIHVISEWRTTCPELLQRIAQSATVVDTPYGGSSRHGGYDALSVERKKNLIATIINTLNILIMTVPFTVITLFKDEFGDDFVELAAVKPPWSLSQMFYLMRKHWLSVFRDHFSRNKHDAEDRFRRLESFVKRWEQTGGSFLLYDSTVPTSSGIGAYTRIRAAIYNSTPETLTINVEEVKLLIKDTIEIMEGFTIMQKEKKNYSSELRASLQQLS